MHLHEVNPMFFQTGEHLKTTGEAIAGMNLGALGGTMIIPPRSVK